MIIKRWFNTKKYTVARRVGVRLDGGQTSMQMKQIRLKIQFYSNSKSKMGETGKRSALAFQAKFQRGLSGNFLWLWGRVVWVGCLLFNISGHTLLSTFSRTSLSPPPFLAATTWPPPLVTAWSQALAERRLSLLPLKEVVATKPPSSSSSLSAPWPL